MAEVLSLPKQAPDEFMIYTYKVQPCSRLDPHNWQDCPYTHVGEPNPRRDPKKYRYQAAACRSMKATKTCPQGDRCRWSHNVLECGLHPTRYRTALCVLGTQCTRPVCFFAHTVEQLRTPSNAQNGDNAPRPRQDGANFSNASLSWHSATRQSASPGVLMLPPAEDNLTSAAFLPFSSAFDSAASIEQIRTAQLLAQLSQGVPMYRSWTPADDASAATWLLAANASLPSPENAIRSQDVIAPSMQGFDNFAMPQGYEAITNPAMAPLLAAALAHASGR